MTVSRHPHLQDRLATAFLEFSKYFRTNLYYVIVEIVFLKFLLIPYWNNGRQLSRSHQMQ